MVSGRATRVSSSQDDTKNRDVTVLILRASAREGGKCQGHRRNAGFCTRSFRESREDTCLSGKSEALHHFDFYRFHPHGGSAASDRYCEVRGQCYRTRWSSWDAGVLSRPFYHPLGDISASASDHISAHRGPVTQRTKRSPNSHLEQDYRGIKQRYRSPRGFKHGNSAACLCLAFDEVRALLCAQSWRRAVHRERFAQLMGLPAAVGPSSERFTSATHHWCVKGCVKVDTTLWFPAPAHERMDAIIRQSSRKSSPVPAPHGQVEIEPLSLWLRPQ